MDPLDARTVVGAFRGAIKPVRPSAGYVLGLLLSTIVMLLLPVLYLAVIGLVVWGLVLYATHATALFKGSGGIIWRGLAYAAPLIAGGIVVLLLLKPLFARPSRHVSPYALERGQEPLLFLFVEQIAQAVGAPAPKRIELTCQPNASASFRRGLLSFFGSDLTLTLGMPFVICMDTRQLAGVIAHELGHFTQGVALRCDYLVGLINRWFARVVYERDSWDDALDAFCAEESLVALLIGLTAKLGVFIGRRVLLVIMMLGHAVTCFTSRRMEYNADRAQIRLVGSDAFGATFDRIEEVAAAFDYTLGELQSSQSNRLPNDLAALTQSRLLVMPPGLQEYLAAVRAVEKTRLFSTHPPTRLRIEHATRQSEPGVFALETPAERLFMNPAVLCQWTTIGLYREGFGLDVSPEQLDPVERVVKQRQLSHTSREAAGRWLPEIDTANLMPAPFATRPVDVAKAPALLTRTAEVMTANRDRIDACAAGMRTAARKNEGLAAALELMTFKLKLRPELVEGGDASPEGVRREQAGARETMAAAHKLLDEYTSVVGRRLDAARAMIAAPACRGVFKDVAKIERHMDVRLERLRTLAAQRERLAHMQSRLTSVHELMHAGRPTDALRSHVEKIGHDLRDDLIALRAATDEGISDVPPADDLGAIFDGAGDAMLHAIEAYSDSMGQLVMITERIERHLAKGAAAPET